MPSGCVSHFEFDRLFAPHRAVLLAQAAAAVGPNDAEDLVQDALLRACARQNLYDPATGYSGLLAWLRDILTNLCTDHQRTLASRAETLLPNNDALTLSDSPDATDADLDAQIQEAFHDDFIRVLPTLPLTDRQRDCLGMYYGGYTQSEIGAFYRISQQAVSKHIERAIKKARKHRVIEASAEFKRMFRVACQAVRYYSPQKTGAALATEKLRRLR